MTADYEYTQGDEAGMTDPPEGWSPEDETAFDGDFVDVDIMEATATVFGSVMCEEFSAQGSAIASASVAGDAEISASAIGAVSADTVAMRQAAATVMVVSGDVAVSQGGAALIVARQVEVETGGACCVVASEATVARSWVGFMAARNATISDDSRVIIDTRAGLIIGAFLFGGLGLLAVATFLGARRIADRMPRMPRMPHMPHMQDIRMPHMADLPKMPDLSGVTDLIAKLRRAS